jgi:hypothetical protein
MVTYDAVELDRLRTRVRAARRAGSAPMLVFGVAMLIFATYQGLVRFMFVPAPLYWPLCALAALLTLWLIERVRLRHSGVGEGRLSYRRAAAALVLAAVAGNMLLFLPGVRMLLWPATVLTVLALWQGNRRLAWWSGIIGAVVIANWFADALLLDSGHQPLYMGAAGAALVLGGMSERSRERSLE